MREKSFKDFNFTCSYLNGKITGLREKGGIYLKIET